MPERSTFSPSILLTLGDRFQQQITYACSEAFNKCSVHLLIFGSLPQNTFQLYFFILFLADFDIGRISLLNSKISMPMVLSGFGFPISFREDPGKIFRLKKIPELFRLFCRRNNVVISVICILSYLLRLYVSFPTDFEIVF